METTRHNPTANSPSGAQHIESQCRKVDTWEHTIRNLTNGIFHCICSHMVYCSYSVTLINL